MGLEVGKISICQSHVRKRPWTPTQIGNWRRPKQFLLQKKPPFSWIWKSKLPPFETYVPYFWLNWTNWTVIILKRIIETDEIWRSILYLIGMGEGQKINNGFPNKIGEMIPLELTKIPSKILFWRCSDEFSPGSLGSLFPVESTPPSRIPVTMTWSLYFWIRGSTQQKPSLAGVGGCKLCRSGSPLAVRVETLIRVQVLISPKFDIESPSWKRNE